VPLFALRVKPVSRFVRFHVFLGFALLLLLPFCLHGDFASGKAEHRLISAVFNDVAVLSFLAVFPPPYISILAGTGGLFFFMLLQRLGLSRRIFWDPAWLLTPSSFAGLLNPGCFDRACSPSFFTRRGRFEQRGPIRTSVFFRRGRTFDHDDSPVHHRTSPPVLIPPAVPPYPM